VSELDGDSVSEPATVAVMGGGSWGTSFSLVLADAGNKVRLWGRPTELCDAINATRENADYLPGIEIPAAVTASHDHAAVLDGADAVAFAVPAQTLRANLTVWAPCLPREAILVSLMKGMELGTHERMSEVIAEVAGVGPERIAVVSGPNLAREIAERQPAASVVASTDADVAARIQRLCHTPAFRPYTNADVVGCELGGTVKNVIALAVGMAVGLGFGDNARASVITRGLAETARLATAMGADAMTLAGLAGLGDLVATCTSPLSRNRTFGEKLGQGLTVDEIVHSTRQVAEGVKSCQSVYELAAEHDVDMPIVEHVAAVVRGELTPKQMLVALVSRTAKPERTYRPVLTGATRAIALQAPDNSSGPEGVERLA
jgi:glycerol-3-phosphate dehydrogenase (NAD(P)+)